MTAGFLENNSNNNNHQNKHNTERRKVNSRLSLYVSGGCEHRFNHTPRCATKMSPWPCAAARENLDAAIADNNEKK